MSMTKKMCVAFVSLIATLPLIVCNKNPVTPSTPAAPALVAPSNGAVNESVAPTLSWTPAAGVSSYEVQVSTGSAFSTIFFDSTLGSPTLQVSGLGFQSAYYWRVKTTTSSGVSAWSAPPWSFATVPAKGSFAELATTWTGAADFDTADPKTQWRYDFVGDSAAIYKNSVVLYAGTYTIDTTTDPKALDLHITASSNAQAIGKTLLTLFSHNFDHGVQDNVMSIKYVEPGFPRPASMATSSSNPVIGLAY
jgi:hypothetical protein